MKIKERYNLNKKNKVGEECVCPSCNSKFIKSNYQQAFCKSKGGTVCKDKYWNTVTPSKKSNTTRGFANKNKNVFDYDEDYLHPFSSEGLGQD